MVAVVYPIQGILATKSKAAGHTKCLCVRFLASAVICWMKVIEILWEYNIYNNIIFQIINNYGQDMDH